MSDNCATIVCHVFWLRTDINTGGAFMKFVTVREFRSKSAGIWRTLHRDDEMVVTSNGKPVALLTPVTGTTLDTTVRSIRRARAAEALNEMQLQSLRNGTSLLTADDIDEEILAVRKARSQHRGKQA